MEVLYLFFGLFVIALVCASAVAAAVVYTKLNKNKKRGKGDYISPKPEQKADGVSPVHANCDHAQKPSPYIDINDTYSMTWDTFKSFALRLLSAEYPSARISPYKYRGSPDIQLQTGGKEVDVRLIFVRGNQVVDKDDFAAALRDVDDKDDVADWIFTNGRFSVTQRGSANARRVALYDAADMQAMMRRCGVSAKDGAKSE